MCGITGFLTLDGDRGASQRILSRMTEVLQHRGPDAGDCWQSPDGVANLGHRRLSIIDLSPTGAQPMTTPDGRFTLSYNGEIFNFLELRQELIARGRTFRGSSDTEVLLYALADWGVPATLRRLNGMFAFGLYDRQERALWLARDRFGEKPLYYAWHNEVLLFGSELKSLAQHPAFKREVNKDVIPLFMRFNYVPWPYSIFHNCWKLSPGHSVRVAVGAPPPPSEAYWTVAETISRRNTQPIDATDPALIDRTEDVLRRAVKARMVSDVPIGAFLSGGIDSSTIVALMQAQSSRPIKTFTIGFREAPYNEAKDAANVARHLGTEHHELYLSTSECLEVIEKLPDIYDEPFADASQIPSTLISRFTRRYVEVALSGDAGDEMFGGYNRYVWTRRIWPRLSRFPLAMRRWLSRLILRHRPAAWERLIRPLNHVLPPKLRVRGSGDKLHKLALTMDAMSPDDLYRSFVSQWQRPADALLIGQEPPWLESHLQHAPPELGYIERMMFLDTMTYLPSDTLCKVDRASMSAGLETRMPFLDPEVVSFAWDLPLESKIHRGIGKWPLRNVLKRYVPPEFFERPKMGFGIPLGDWIRGPMRDWAEDSLNRRALDSTGIFRSEVVEAQWREHLSGTHNHQYALWGVLMFQAWFRKWVGAW